MYNITFRQNGKEIAVRAEAGENLLSVLRSAGIDLDAPCSGNGVCGKCRVILAEGEVSGGMSRHITAGEYRRGVRLACESRVCTDAVIDIPEAADSFRTGIVTADLSTEKERSAFEASADELEKLGLARRQNPFSLLSLTLSEPTLDDTCPDVERVRLGVMEKAGCSAVRFSSVFVRKAAFCMRRYHFDFCLPVEKMPDGSLFVYDILPAGENRVCGVAVDIGTTTVTAVLADLLSGSILSRASAGNAQIRYGADVINRIIAASREGGLKLLQDAVVTDTLKPMIERMCRSCGIGTDAVCKLTIAANTTMNHLFAGCWPEPVRMEPYIPSFFETEAFRGHDFDLGIHPDAAVLFAPNVGSYVGGDITAGTLVSRIWAQPEFSLFVDLGTNGEIVFGNSDFLMCCACSAGPAFEGGDISCGMRATAGAIDRVVIDPETMEPEYSTIGGLPPLGLCGSGLIDTVSELFRCGIISPKGQFIRSSSRIVRDESGIARYIMAAAPDGPKEVSIDEVDIANFIRAKGAIFSAVITMLSSLEMDVSMIGHIYIAGGIGSGLNIKNAVSVGMLPRLDENCYTYLGNTALSGALCMLLSDPARDKIMELGSGMTYIELSTQPGYMDEFVAACFLPHTNAALFAGPTDE